MSQDEPKVWQPLHTAVRAKLDPEYVAFHDQYMQYVQPDDSKVWDGTARTQPSLPPGGIPPVPVGDIKDFRVGQFRLRAYTPTGECDLDGWPVLLWFHGGGWAIGGLDDNKDFCTFLCQESKCIVITVDYRLAPEHRFPTAVNDSIDAFRWVSAGPSELGPINTSRIAIGGTSAGANLAVVAALSAVDPSVTLPLTKPSLPNCIFYPPVSLLLVVPVIDNTATADSIWKRNAETAPWLTPARMEWYRKLYFNNQKERSGWDASPNFAPESLLKRLPRTWMAVSDQDILAPEAESFAEQLEGLGVPVDVVNIEGGTHSILTLGGKIARSREMMQDAASHLKRVFEIEDSPCI
ncbi:Alpha/Beta hydrolase protein [Dactylonectria macrodidyma]|uniref:Alpha/Beta hydrolase protein n=1 Tax=Dactylonectria macrodidyma TaxID=307937 RepID=A0A9P9IFY8_9HYPO|nr:Alpha/Beta hydrolase protein [Dactylonectria macrodidyma]